MEKNHPLKLIYTYLMAALISRPQYYFFYLLDQQMLLTLIIPTDWFKIKR